MRVQFRESSSGAPGSHHNAYTYCLNKANLIKNLHQCVLVKQTKAMQ